MVWIRMIVLFLLAFSEVSMAEIATNRGSRPTGIFGRPIAQVSADYFRDTNPIMARERHREFQRLFDRFASHPDLAQSTAALEKALAFYVKHRDGISVSCGGTRGNHQIQGDWIVVTDFTLPSTQHRQFYINLRTGEVRKSYATHGSGSSYATANSPVDRCPPEHVIQCGRGATACAIPISFDDVGGSHRTQTGFYLTGAQNTSGKQTFTQGQPPSNGDYNSIILHGAVRSTAQAQQREVIYHRASYVTDPNSPPNPCATSWGCPATDPQTFEDIKDELVEGTLFYNHTIQEELTVNPSC